MAAAPVSTHPADQILKPMLNIFNPHAVQGERPLSIEEITGQLNLYLLLSQTVLVPGHSLVSHPVVHEWLQKDSGSLRRLFQTGKLAPVLTDKEPTFAAAAEYRLKKKSAGLDAMQIQPSELPNVAKSLDQLLTDAGAHPVLLDRAVLDDEKTRVSLPFIDALHAFVPGTRANKEEIKRHFYRELDSKGAISGTTWHRLIVKFPELRPYKSRLGEIGALTFDYANAAAVGHVVAGHAYRRPCTELIANSIYLAPHHACTIEEGEIAEFNTPVPAILDSNLLSQCSVDTVLNVTARAALERERYEHGLRAFFENSTSDSLNEAKARLDEYIIALDAHSDHELLRSLADDIRRNRKMELGLRFLRAGHLALWAVCAGSAPIAEGLFGKDPHEEMLMSLVTAVTAGAAKYLGSRTKTSDQRLRMRQEQLDAWRPLSFSLPPIKQR